MFPAVPVPSIATASLYVGDLHEDVSEAFLFGIFKQCGIVQSIRVCRDILTRRSLGYAYVNFVHREDAERALETLNHTRINETEIRVSWVQKDPLSRKRPELNLVVKNLQGDIDNKSLFELFSSFGEVVSAKVQHRRHSGIGYVQFKSAESATEAIDKINGMMLNGKIVEVEYFKYKRREVVDDSNFTNCYVKNLKSDVDDDDLESAFAVFGEVTSVKVMKTAKGKSRGFGFCAFVRHEDAVKAVAAMNGSTDSEIVTEGGSLVCCRHQSQQERSKALLQMHSGRFPIDPTNVFVKNLADSVTSEELRSMFEEFGDISSAVVKVDDQSGLSKCFGFVKFENAESAAGAIDAMHQRMVSGKPLFVALHQPRFVRRRYLEDAGRMARGRRILQRGDPRRRQMDFRSRQRERQMDYRRIRQREREVVSSIGPLKRQGVKKKRLREQKRRRLLKKLAALESDSDSN